jgi:sortase (surface protein transpeptidase)
VVQTLKKGDPVRLLMANNDIVAYRVDNVEQVAQENVDIMGGNTPGLVVILYRKDSNNRWIIVCRP